jgi:hypothetical protein
MFCCLCLLYLYAVFCCLCLLCMGSVCFTQYVLAACAPAGFCSDEDSLVLEDEGARMSMRSECAELQPDSVVTGGVVGIAGVLQDACTAFLLDAILLCSEACAALHGR